METLEMTTPTAISKTERQTLTVEDAVTQIEIEHKDTDKLQCSDGNDTEETNATMINNDSTDTLDTPNPIIDEQKDVDGDDFTFKDDEVPIPHDPVHSALTAEAKTTETTSSPSITLRDPTDDVAMTDGQPTVSADTVPQSATNPDLRALQQSVQRMDVDQDQHDQHDQQSQHDQPTDAIHSVAPSTPPNISK